MFCYIIISALSTQDFQYRAINLPPPSCSVPCCSLFFSPGSQLCRLFFIDGSPPRFFWPSPLRLAIG